MIKLTVMLVIATTLWANTYRWPIVRVVDADTVEVAARWLPIELGKTMRIRIDGVDAPESGGRASCAAEAQLALEAKQFVQAAIASSKRQRVTVRAWDKYGGRILGDIILDGISLSQLLLDHKYAKPYAGGKKSTWCD